MLDVAPFTHVILVDCENVPRVDLEAIDGRSAAVFLLLGKNQPRLEVPFVQQIRRYAAQVDLIEVGASGRNALDLTLAFYLGQAASRAPTAHFHIISKDTDFDPLIAHLNRRDVRVSRHASLAALPFARPAAKPKKPAAPKPAAPRPAATTPAPATTEQKLEKLVQRLQADVRNRPKTRASLLRLVGAELGRPLAPDEQQSIIEDLVQSQTIALDGNRVTYPEGGAGTAGSATG